MKFGKRLSTMAVCLGPADAAADRDLRERLAREARLWTLGPETFDLR